MHQNRLAKSYQTANSMPSKKAFLQKEHVKKAQKPSQSALFLTSLISSFTILLLWQGASVLIGKAIILPGPILVLSRFTEFVCTYKFWQALGATFLRGVIGFTLSFVPALILGFAAGRNAFVYASLKPLLSIIKSTPVLAIIIIALIWFGIDFMPIFAAFLMAFPIMIQAVIEGTHAIDKNLTEMADIFSLTQKQKIRTIYFPSLLPFLAAGVSSSLGLTWKVVVAAEVISQPVHAIGTGMQTARANIETADVLAWTLTTIILCSLSDLIFSFIIKKVKIV